MCNTCRVGRIDIALYYSKTKAGHLCFKIVYFFLRFFLKMHNNQSLHNLDNTANSKEKFKIISINVNSYFHCVLIQKHALK